MFGVRSDNGKIVFIDLMNNEFMKTEPYLDDIANAETVCREKAIEIANELLGDLDDYLEEQSKPITQTKEKDGIKHTITYYYFTFYKQYAGFKSSDYITVRVTSKGHLASVVVGDTNSINDNIEIDSDQLEIAINEKLESVYSNNDYLINNSDVEEQIIVKGPDGRYYIYTTMKINLLDNGNSINTAICLLTLIG